MRSGFSLIEILIVIAIGTSLVFVVASLNSNVNVLNNLVSQELQAKSDVNQALQVMTSDIRSASISANGAYPIDAAGTSSFAFYGDPDGDGVVERVRYFLASSTVSSSSIWRGIIQPTGTPATYPTATEALTDMIDNIIIPTSTPLFSYYDTSYTGTQPAMTSTAAVQNIRLVGVSFLSDVNPKKSPAPQYFSILVDIRNLRSN